MSVSSPRTSAGKKRNQHVNIISSLKGALYFASSVFSQVGTCALLRVLQLAPRSARTAALETSTNFGKHMHDDNNLSLSRSAFEDVHRCARGPICEGTERSVTAL